MPHSEQPPAPRGRPRILVGPEVTDQVRLLLADPEVRAVLEEAGEVVVGGDAAAVLDADAVLLTGRLPALTEPGRLRLVAVTGSGYTTLVDVPGLHALGVDVASVPAYGAEAVAEHPLALVLALAKNLLPAAAAVRNGQWPELVSLQLAGATAGVVGAGTIGRRMARLLTGAGMEVLVWNRTRDPARLADTRARYVDLPELFDRADVVSLHLAHAPDTEGLVTHALLDRLAPGSVVVNTARAQIVADGALEHLAGTGRLRVATDVLRVEPPDAATLAGLPPELLVTPHAAYNTAQAARAVVLGAARNIAAHLAGAATNVVPRDGADHPVPGRTGHPREDRR